MSSILVIDDLAVIRDPIAASLRLAGYSTFVAKDGAEGLAKIRQNRPDLVLLDISMPMMDGISLLRAMRNDPAVASTPVILLTASVDKKFVLEAAKLGVREYLLKSRFSLKELDDRIKRSLAGKRTRTAQAASAPQGKPSKAIPSGDIRSKTEAPVPAVAASVTAPSAGQPKLETFAPENFSTLMTAQQCISRVEDCMAGKTLSGAVAEVLMLASRPSAELKDLSALITRDPVLSVRVLQMANSAAFFSRRGAVTTITEAVKNIGANNVRNIAASVGIFDAMPASSADGFNPIRCWQHSFAVARLCETFVVPTSPDEAGLAYLVGLCHDLGDIMFRTRFEKEYQSVLDVQQRTGAPLEEIEQHLLGMTHMEILKIILKCMGLPDTIRTPIEQFQNAIKQPVGRPIIPRALAMAESFANGLLLASSESSTITPITESDWMDISGRNRLTPPDGEELRSQVYCLTAILSRMNPTDQAGLMQAPYKKSNATIWLARDPLLSSADPFAEALSGMANTQVYQHLPSPEQMKDFSGLAIESRGTDLPGWTWPNIEQCLARDISMPVLWLTSSAPSAADDKPAKPMKEVSLRTIQAFIANASRSRLGEVKRAA
jgi:HD-like signal output (HDOD) protein/CheY-like chemotaxis protein